MHSDAYSTWSETGIDFSVAGRLVDHGDIQFDGASDLRARCVAQGAGWSISRQVIDLIHSINQPIVAADIVEFNPRRDISNLTAIVAAKLLKEIGGMMVKTAEA